MKNKKVTIIASIIVIVALLGIYFFSVNAENDPTSQVSSFILVHEKVYHEDLDQYSIVVTDPYSLDKKQFTLVVKEWNTWNLINVNMTYTAIYSISETNELLFINYLAEDNN